jgi:hypothetical protein
MAGSNAFTTLCEELERSSTLDRLEARGTVRLALKQGGLEASNASAAQLVVIAEKILPDELRTRGIDDPEAVCSHLTSALMKVPEEQLADSPEAVFKRLGG